MDNFLITMYQHLFQACLPSPRYSVVMDKYAIHRHLPGVTSARVVNFDPSRSILHIPSESDDIFHTNFSRAPLPRDRVTCWTARVLDGCKPYIYIYVGVDSKPWNSYGYSDMDTTAIVWGGWRGVKKTHGYVCVLEPGLGRFDINDIIHLKYDPRTLQLHLRLDRKPNCHFTAPLRAGLDYYVCICICCSGAFEVQTKAPW